MFSNSSVLLDESGQQVLTKPVLVGATVVHDLDRLEGVVRDLYDDLKDATYLQGTESFEHFLQQGFHNWQVPLDVQLAFVRELARTDGFRIFVAFSRRERLSITDDQRCFVLYSSLLRDVVRYVKAETINFYFEENHAMQSKFSLLVDDAAKWANRRALKQREQQFNVHIVSKMDLMSMAVTDFALAIISRWLVAGANRDPSAHEYRAYRAIERDVALLYDFDHNQRSTRADRAFV